VSSGTTDADGEREFQNLTSGTCTVKLADSNFATGGALAGWYPARQKSAANRESGFSGKETADRRRHGNQAHVHCRTR
jgi:hypothetical protein